MTIDVVSPVAGHRVAGHPVAGQPIAGHPIAGHPIAGGPSPAQPRRAPRVRERPEILRPLGLGLLSGVMFIGLLAGWSYLAPLSSAAVASGQVVADGNRRTVQHLEGGIIRELLVKDGDHVRAGQVIVRLDDTQSAASSDLTRGQWDALRAQDARLVAELGDAGEIKFPDDLVARRADPRVGDLINGQRQLFDARRLAFSGIIAVLNERAEQTRSEIKSYEGLLRSVQEQLTSIGGEVADVQALVDKGYERRSRLLSLQRQAAQLTGSKDQYQAMIARARQAITETELQMAQQTSQRRNDVANEQRDLKIKLVETEEKVRAADDVQVRRDVTAPIDGFVTNSRFHTIGGVVKPGDPLLDIVADQEALVVEVRITPTDIDIVEPGQEAEVRFTAFKQRSTPTVLGKVTYVAADVETDQKTNASYYRGRVQIPDDQMALLGKVKLTSGMPAEVMIHAGERTLAQYLAQPLIDSFHRAFREQ